MNLSDKIQTSDVFKTQGNPRYTYVSVSGGTYETNLRNAINNKGTLCLITGPSKTGKTTLVSNVCANMHLKPLIVRCSADLAIHEFWKKALEQVDFSRVTETSNAKMVGAEVGAEIEGKFGWAWLASITGKFSSTFRKERSEEECREKILADSCPEHLIPVLKCSSHFLIVEDFHYLQPNVQKNIFQQWKVFVDEEVSVAVIGTTHHAYDLAFANKDLIGRVFHLPMTTWTEKDLAEIVNKGFKFLAVEIDPKTVRFISEESVGLPLITQAICLGLALSQSIFESQSDPIKLVLHRKDILKLLNDIATSKFSQFETMYSRIAQGLRRRQKRKYDTYECLLSVFTLDPIVYKLNYPAIIDRLSKLPLPKEKLPPAEIVKSSLTRLNQLQEKIGATLLDWYRKDETLYILEPSFLFYLRWRKQRSSSPTIYDVFKDLVSGLEISLGKGGMITVKVSSSQTITGGKNIPSLLSENIKSNIAGPVLLAGSESESVPKP